MSDDEYYDSPYDEFEEMLWDADPAPHLADDLAQHAAHSPVWQDDPVGELDAYHSDWEYYSDDYFDDDPAILRINPVDGSLPPNGSKKDVRLTRGRKRKIDEVSEAMEGPEAKFLRSTLRGTVWADNASPVTKIFHHGQQEKVALLIDWRERFQLGSSRPNSPTRTLKRDESWANDLSLDAMGLKRIRERSGTQQDMAVEDDATDEDAEDGEGSESLEELQADVQENGTLNADSEEQENSQGQTASFTDTPDYLTTISTNEKNGSFHGSPNTNPPETKATSRGLSDIRSLDPGGNIEESNQQSVSRNNENSRWLSTMASESASRRQGSIASERPGKEVENDELNGILQRKRKLSSSSEDSLGLTGSTISSRAKRIASKKLGFNQTNGTSTESLSANTKSTKSRKS